MPSMLSTNLEWIPMTYQPLFTALAVSSLALLGACSSPKDASKDNFEKALQSYHDSVVTPYCVSAGGADYPLLLAKQNTLSRDKLEQQDALVAAGLLTRSEGETEESRGFMNPKKVMVPAYKYEILADAKQQFKPGENGAGFIRRGQFCFGKVMVDEVKSFTEPADRMGMKISQASYSYRVQDVPVWAEHAAVQAAFPHLVAELKKTETRAALVLTSEGWVHEKMMR